MSVKWPHKQGQQQSTKNPRYGTSLNNRPGSLGSGSNVTRIKKTSKTFNFKLITRNPILQLIHYVLFNLYNTYHSRNLLSMKTLLLLLLYVISLCYCTISRCAVLTYRPAYLQIPFFILLFMKTLSWDLILCKPLYTRDHYLLYVLHLI